MGSAAEVPSLVLVKLKQALAARAQAVAQVLAMGLELLQSDIRVAALEVEVPLALATQRLWQPWPGQL